MALLNPILLAGILFASVPIAIHLLNRSRFRVEHFGAMMFLRQALAVKAQKLRMRQLLLLLLRCLILTLLAIALARPVLTPRTGVSDDEPTTHVLVIDASLSMDQGEGAQNAFHQARESALDLIADMGDSDNMQIIWGAAKPTPLFPALTFDRVHLQNRVRSLETLAEAMNMPAALEQAFWATDSSTLPRRRIYIITDGQANGWRKDDGLAWERLKRHWELLEIRPFVYVLTRKPDTPVQNVAIAKITTVSPLVDVCRPTQFVCEIHNYGDDRRSVAVRFLVDGQVRAERRLDLAPGHHDVHFEHLFAEAGSHYVTMQTDADGLRQDDSLTKAIIVMRRVRLLVIEGRSDENPWKSDGRFLQMALEAGSNTRDEEGGLFDITVRPQAEMDACGLDYLKRFHCLVLTDVASISDYFMFSLERFVEEGGGLLIGLGNGAVPTEYSRIFKDGKGILPARLDRIRTYDKRYFQPTFPAGSAAGVLDYFDVSRTRVIQSVNVAKYWHCLPTGDASVLAHFDGAPFLVYRPYGEGRTILWTTSLNADWSNFPLTPDFLPLVQDLAVFLAASVTPPINVGPGETILYSSQQPATGDDGNDISSPVGGTDAIVCEVTLPDGERRSFELGSRGDEWLGKWQDTNLPGLYTFAAPPFPVRYFAVIPSVVESDLEELSETEIEQLSETPMELVFTTDKTKLVAEIRKETGVREWWQPMALAVLALICLETLASWRLSL